MKVEILQEDFSGALNLTSRFVSTRAALPVLSNILLEAKKGKLSILATNLEASICKNIGAKILQEGEISVNAKVIFEIIANLSHGSVLIESEKEGVKIFSEGFSGRVSGLSSSEFPVVPRELSKNAFELDIETLLNSLSKIIFATSKDETRPILTGVLFIFEKGVLSLVSSDGFRLSRISFKDSKLNLTKRITIPRSVLSEIIRIKDETGHKIYLDFKEEENQALFSFSDSVIASRVIEGDFPNFEKIIPKSIATKVYVDRETFVRAIKLASAFARDSANIIKITVNENNVEISSQSAKSGEQKTKMDARVEGVGLTISYNYRFLEEFLGICESEEVEIGLNDSASPGVFRDSKNPDFLHLIMPVKI
ncbi:MAG: DNA polymerase III subunit beta [Candidatus Woesebacteria bacterium]|nr:MAG: DNA polymerase III subunit beta [Candidatus Woesebacteria bacterium]